ncbi:MAG TPA: O-antigen ligase family protein [Vicinamibacterales bacterium]
MALLATVAAVILQLVPLPPALLHALSPSATVVDRAIHFDSRIGWQPLSLNPPETAIALLVDLLALGVFWIIRDAVAGGGMRTFVRTILGVGLVVSVAAIVGGAIRSPASHLVYGLFEPTDPAARPYGPFVNRNEMAMWVLLALPLIVGYAGARIRRRSQSGCQIVDATTVWFAGGAAVLIAALVLSLSRSGIIAAAAEALVAVAVSLNAAERRSHVALAAFGIGAAAITIALAMPRTSELIGRFDRTLTIRGADGRTAIWRDTRAMIRDFPWTGVGAGAYPTGMLVYQQGSRLFFNNHAHDEYLQVIAEGGALVAVPLAIAVCAFALLVVARLRSDRSARYWIRAGAVTGVAGALLQSVWEVGLAAPANALLFAAVCAIAVHRENQGEPAIGSPERP